MKPTWYHWDGDTLILTVHIQPRAARDEIAGVHADHLKLRIAAPPVSGKANTQLIGFLASEFRVPRSQIKLLSGERSRDKRIAIRTPKTHPDWMSASQE
ncbi:MAG: DUF167 family protein [Gammaproteobacteria bacterium]